MKRLAELPKVYEKVLHAVYKDWQRRAREEVIELFGRNNPNPDGITRLRTMNMIIEES